VSDLANSCEYLTIDKLCSAVSEREKAKAKRQVVCQNEEKMSCCYLCLSRNDCTIKCRFLGNIENESSPVEDEKTNTETGFDKVDEKTEVNQTEPQVTYCSSCNAEMSQTTTKVRISGWEGLHPKLSGDESDKLGEELPMIVCLCRQCGKIEFKADDRLNKN
jgi:hypothetical protein